MVVTPWAGLLPRRFLGKPVEVYRSTSELSGEITCLPPCTVAPLTEFLVEKTFVVSFYRGAVAVFVVRPSDGKKFLPALVGNPLLSSSVEALNEVRPPVASIALVLR